MINIKISVVIPNYNGEKYIKRVVKSIQAQSVCVYEIIIVDDCSTDNSKNIICALTQNNCRIKAIYLEKNLGVAHARNVGIKKASGEYILFADVDDILPVDAILHYSEAMNQFEGMNIYQGMQDMRGSGKTYLLDVNTLKKLCLGYPRSLSYFNNLSVSVKNSVHGCYGKLYNREFLNTNKIEFRQNMGLGEDLVFYYEVLKYSENVCIIEHEVYKIIYETGSATRSFNPKMSEYALTFAKIIRMMENNPIYKNEIAYQINQHVNKAFQCNYGHPQNTEPYFKRVKEFKIFLSNSEIHNAYIELANTSNGVHKIRYELLKHKHALFYFMVSKIEHWYIMSKNKEI